MTKTPNFYLISPQFQIILISISALFLGFAIRARLSVFQTIDKAPIVTTVTPKKLEEFGGFPEVVKVGLYVNSFERFDIVNNDFIFTGIIWFEFNPGAISLETLEKFDFEKGKILDRSPPDTQLTHGKLLVRYTIRVQFISSLDYRYFPLDDHRIYLTLVHQFVLPSEINFSAVRNDFMVKPSLHVYGWNEIAHYVKSGYSKYSLTEYDTQKTLYHPSVLFSIDCAQDSPRYMLLVLLPLLFLFYFIGFSFSLQTGNISLTTLGVTAMLAYRFVIETLSPKAGYFMISDHIFFLLLFASLLIFFLNIIREAIDQLKIFHTKTLFVLIHVIVTSINVYLIVFWS